MTHFVIVSDGDLWGGDMQATVDKMVKLFSLGPQVSIDIAVLGTGRRTVMDNLVDEVKRIKPQAQISILNATSAKDAPLLIAKRIKGRMELSTRGVKAVPDKLKREQFGTAARAMSM
jgi:hypothetical protein